ncbi:flippase [uncultured Ruminococcus sp.]|uniref:flippase n=1 Tax=uncultured Ruminococcus sp. TaxID=165186 RepID=UPI0025D64164|nr:flippase [uncultured Ruminococcus sp.]
MSMILTVSSMIFPLISYPYVSRILMPSGMGKVAFATSIVTYFSMFAQLGIPTYGIRTCAKVRDDKKKLSKTVCELFIVNTITTFLSYVVLFSLIFLLPRLKAEKNLYLIISVTILLNSLGMEWLYRALEKYTYITIRSIIFKLLSLILMFILIHSKKDYVLYGFLTVFAASASNILNFINVRKYINFKINENLELKKHLKPILVFFLMSIATTIYTNLDNVMLGFMKTDDDVGYYNAAVKIKSVLVSVVTSLGSVLMPRSSYYIENNKIDDFKKITFKALNFVLVISIPLVLFFIMFAREGIVVLSGIQYEKAVSSMQVIMPTLIFIGITNILGLQMMVPLGKEKYVLLSEIIGAIIDLGINLLLIPHLGALGAAIGTLFAEFAVLIVQILCVKEYAIAALTRISYGKIFISTIISGTAVLMFKKINCNVFLTLLLASLTFFGIYFCGLFLMKENLAQEIFMIIKNKVVEKRNKND